MTADPAIHAAALFGAPQTPRLISHRENAVYEMTLPTGRAALRLHRPGYRTASQIRSELDWTEALADAGFRAPRPLRSTEGALIVHLPDGQIATLIAWVDGTPLGATDTARTLLYRRVGALLAHLHGTSDALTLPPDFTRPAWDRDALTGADPLWGRYWTHPALTAETAQTLRSARDRARDLLTAHASRFDMGLIHADALRENVIETPAGLALIDFDDSGIGYRMYDLASALTQSLDDADYPALTEALIDGYTAIRPIAAGIRALFPVFAMLRSFSAVGWMIPRVPAGDPKTPLYIGRALRQARAFLNA